MCAQVPLDLEAEQLLSENLQLKGNLHSAAQKIAQLQTSSVDLEEDLERYKAFLLCQICFSNDADVVLVSCGHMLCRHCESNLRNTNCPFCRKHIEKLVPFYKP